MDNTINRDVAFLNWAKERNISFDSKLGKLYNKKGKELSTKQKRLIAVTFEIDGKYTIISRGRAIWILVNGPTDGIIMHDNDMLFDGIDNLKCVSKHEYYQYLGKKGNAAVSEILKKDSKLTLEIVNEMRRLMRAKIEGRDMTITYQRIADKYGISKQSALFAIMGRTWKNATEEPVGAMPKEFSRLKPNGYSVKRVRRNPPATISKNTTSDVLKERKLQTAQISIMKKTRIEILSENNGDAIRVIKMMTRNNPSLSADSLLRFLSSRALLGNLNKNDVNYIMKMAA